MALDSNAKQSIPALFVEIIKNDARRDALKASVLAGTGTMTQMEWRELQSLREEKARLRQGAEKALQWNKDKGNQAQ